MTNTNTSPETRTTIPTAKTCTSCKGHGVTFTDRVDRAKVEVSASLCLCGCNEMANPKKNFRPGHDSRVKGYVSRALKVEAGDEKVKDEYRIPAILMERANLDADLTIAGHNAETILRLAKEVVGTF